MKRAVLIGLFELPTRLQRVRAMLESAERTAKNLCCPIVTKGVEQMLFAKRILSSISAVVAAAAVFGVVPTASASGDSDANQTSIRRTIEIPGVDIMASYRGASINLTRDGWGDAQACIVYSPSNVQCLNAAETEDQLGIQAWECANGWVCLYQDRDGKGRRLIFNDDYWHDLGSYNFRNQASSWVNAQNGFDTAQLRDFADSDPGGAGWTRQLGGSTFRENLDGNLNDSADEVHG